LIKRLHTKGKFTSLGDSIYRQILKPATLKGLLVELYQLLGDFLHCVTYSAELAT